MCTVLTFDQGPSDNAAAIHRMGNALDEVKISSRKPVARGVIKRRSFSRAIAAISASHSRAADSVSVLSTGCRSNVERLITFSTSAVAVCCCSDSRSSFSSRVFSIAMTACAAKFCEQLDLFVGERTDLLPVDGDGADQVALLEHGDAASVRAPAKLQWQRSELLGCVWLCPEVGNVNDCFVAADVRPVRYWGGMNRLCAAAYSTNFAGASWCATMRNAFPSTATELPNGVANPRRVLQHGLEYRLQIARRAGDDLEHLRGRGLLLQRFVRSSVRWRSSLSSRVFSMAMTAWAAKFVHQLDLLVGERPHFLAVDGDRRRSARSP